MGKGERKRQKVFFTGFTGLTGFLYSFELSGNAWDRIPPYKIIEW